MGSETSDRLEGKWYPARSSRTVPAWLRLERQARFAVAGAADDRTLAAGDARAVKVSARVGNIPRRLELPDGSIFETPDNDGIDRLFSSARAPAASLAASLEQFRPRLFVFVALIVALSIVVYRYAVPVLVEIAIAVTPPVVPELMSRSVMISLDQSVFDESALAPERREGIASAFRDIAAHSARGADAYVLHFRDADYVGPNAFALPDGTIVVTDELVLLAEGDDEAVLGVLGHEIGHVEHDHSLRRLYRAAGVAGLIMLIGGDIGSGAQDLLVQGSALLSLSYSRSDEQDADRYSVEIMARAGRDPTAIARLFQLFDRRSGSGGATSFFSTHPATQERIEETIRYAEEVKARLAR